MSATFLYDADGNRVKGTVAGVTTVYLAGLYEYQNGAVTKYYEGGALRRTGYATDNGVFYVVSDQLRSTSVLVNQNGTVKDRNYYYPYGGNRGGSAFSGITTKRFTGQYHEQGLPGAEGLSYYNARWYDAQIGVFVSADPLVPSPGDPRTFNRYAYVGGNPLRFIDPTGHMQVCDDGGSACGGPRTVVTPAVQRYRAWSYAWAQASQATTRAASRPRPPLTYNASRRWSSYSTPVAPARIPSPRFIPTAPRQAVTPMATPSPAQITANQRSAQAMVEVFDGLWQTAWGIKSGDSYLYGHTTSFGTSINGGVGAGVTFGLQALAADGDGNMAFLAVQKGGMGIAGGVADITVWRQVTNAPTVNYPLNGVTVFAGGSGAVGIGAGIDAVVVGHDSSGRPYLGAQGSVEIGAAANPLTVAEFHGGAYHTGNPFWRVNIYDLLGYPRPSQR